MKIQNTVLESGLDSSVESITLVLTNGSRITVIDSGTVFVLKTPHDQHFVLQCPGLNQINLRTGWPGTYYSNDTEH